MKFVPAASGAPGTCMRFGKFIRQGWMGVDYLVARRVLPDSSAHVFHAAPSAGFANPPRFSIIAAWKSYFTNSIP